MKTYRKDGYEFNIKRIQNEKEIVKVEIFSIWGKEKYEVQTGYMKAEEAHKAFGYNIEEDEAYYTSIPDIGYINKITIE